MNTIITYGTFDILHVGHINLFNRLKEIGNKLIVGVSTDEFNKMKGKDAFMSFDSRVRIIKSLRQVDLVIPEENWNQKIEDIKKYNVSTLAMGSDWEGKFDDLKVYCKVIYFKRTENIDSTTLRSQLYDASATLQSKDLLLNNLKNKLD